MTGTPHIVPAQDNAPLNEAEIEALLAPLADCRHVLAAVSGGPDSVAMMGILARWSDRTGAMMSVATIDHQLRPGSDDEAKAVARAALALGKPHRVLVWEGPKPASGLQDAARNARYRLLEAFAAEIGATHLVTAHTLDDQAETIMMRLAAGSGLAGLVGMRASLRRGSLTHLRPFLDIPKARMVATCEAMGLFYLHDPSNRDPRFTRARWRTIMPLLAQEGLDARRLARLAARAGRIEEALSEEAAALVAASRQAGDEHRYDLAVWAHRPFEIVLRALAMALLAASGEPYRRLERLERLAQDILAMVNNDRSGAQMMQLRRTIAGFTVCVERGPVLVIRPEGPRQRGVTGPQGTSDTGSLGNASWEP